MTTSERPKLDAVPLSLEEANAFVSRHHRHHKPVVGHKFSIGAALVALVVAAVWLAVLVLIAASRAVAQLVLIDGRFDTLPGIVAEGRRVTSNIERVANLFITSTVYAMGLSLAIVVSTLPFPFLARHLTLVGSLTIGIPAFFLALAPSRRRTRSGMVARVLKFAVPTGLVAT